MIYSVNLIDLAASVSPRAFSQYLKETGWRSVPTKKSYIQVFQLDTDTEDFFQVTIPLDKSLIDYKHAMYRAIETVAMSEARSMEDLLLFLLNPNTDILKIRLERKETEAGNILIDDAIRLYDNAKKLLAAAAQDVIRPQRYHKGRADEAVNKFIGNCRFGQTEIGSYVVSVVCPFAELDETNGYRQLSIFSKEEQCADSLTRKVTNRVMRNVSFIKNNVDGGNLDALVSDDESSLISANFYEALIGLNLDADGANVEFVAQWSPVVKKNRCSNDHVLLSHDYCAPISAAVEKLRETGHKPVRIVGRIKRLESAPDAAKRTSGKITVVYLNEDSKARTATVSLNKADYDKAIFAHSRGSYVTIDGEIINSGRTLSINCESFSIPE